MASDIDICIASVAHIGEDANIASIDPPEDSAYAEYCARFYPQARDTLLAMHDFDFNTREVDGVSVTPENEAWQYAYAWPNNALNVFAVLPRDATNNYAVTYATPGLGHYTESLFASPPQSPTVDFESGTLSTGARVVYTNQPNAKLRCAVRVTDAGLFSPLFTEALGYFLASYLAGPVIKGSEGRLVAKEMRAIAFAMFGTATSRDAGQQQRTDAHVPTWIRNR